MMAAPPAAFTDCGTIDESAGPNLCLPARGPAFQCVIDALAANHAATLVHRLIGDDSRIDRMYTVVPGATAAALSISTLDSMSPGAPLVSQCTGAMIQHAASANCPVLSPTGCTP